MHFPPDDVKHCGFTDGAFQRLAAELFVYSCFLVANAATTRGSSPSCLTLLQPTIMSSTRQASKKLTPDHDTHMTSQNNYFKDVTQSTTCDICHRTFGTVRGMRIHQGKVCRKKTKTQSRPEASGSGRQTRGSASPETHHSGADAPHVSESSHAHLSSNN